jgi:hypothetical protein
MNGTRKKKNSTKKKSFYDGERTVVHLKLPAAIKDGLRQRSELKDVLLSKIWDEASERLLAKASVPGSVIYEHPAKRVDYGTVWIANPLIERLRKLAHRDDVSLARVIHTAFARYLDDTQK